MPNPYYNGGAFPATGAPATSASMRAELASISAGFDKLPTLSTNAGRFALVNASATALTVSSVLSEASGNITIAGGLAVTGTLSGAGFSSYLASPPAIGGTTPAAGAFTTLSASSTVSGAGFSTYLASPPAIGGTAAAAGSFTTLSASGAVTLSGGTANGVLYLNGSKVATSGSALTFDGTNFTTTGYAAGNGLRSLGGNTVRFYNAANANWSQISAPAGTGDMQFDTGAGEQMRLTSTGLGIGTSSPQNKLVVSNAGAAGFEFDPTNGIMQTYNRSGAAYTNARIYALNFEVRTGAAPAANTFLLDSSGNLGIGTSSPTARVHAYSGTAMKQLTVDGTGGIKTGVNFANGGTTYGQIYFDNNAPYDMSVVQQYTTGSLIFGTNSTERARIDSSGNLGLGVTPSAWGTYKAMQVGQIGAFWANPSGADVYLSANYYFGAAADRYIATGAATYYKQNAGAHIWGTAPSGTAGNAISFTQAMTLTANGRLLVGTTTDSGAYALQLGGDILLQSTSNGVYSNNFLSVSSSADTKFINNADWIWQNTTPSTLMTLKASGNLGLGVTPSAWTVRALQVAGNASLSSVNGADVAYNAFYDGAWKYVSAARALLYSQVAGSGEHRWFTAPSGTAGNTISFTQAMTLDANGYLGVGLTSPAGRVHIKGAAGASALQQLAFQYHGSASNYLAIGLQDGTGQAQIMSGSGAALIFYTDSDLVSTNERARIDISGNLLVGTTAQIAGSTSRFVAQYASADYVGRLDNSNATPFGLYVSYASAAPNGTGNLFLACADNATTRLTIRSNGGIANYQANDTNLSDRREKTNFAPAKSYLDTICAIPVQTFNYIDQSEDDTGLTLGVVAQDVQAVAPELVQESNWGTEDNPKMRLSVYQTDLQYALMKAIQELKAQNDDLRARVAQLERQA